ncbi:MAG: F0F1 ATP synthase subunit A [Deltaproteobacteria bacterium]|nr:F0F1 ATP synthase subunit A [Deltaproteobacteria bacterium]
MEHPIFFIDSILSAIGLEHFSRSFSHVTHAWLVMLILIVSALLFARGVQLLPKKGQNFFEILLGGLENFMVEITGPEGRFFFPYIATIFLFILTSNLIGLIPGFNSPTANLNTTLALAICSFVLTHAIGIKFHGVKYIKHFSVRLFGNIFGKEMVLSILFMLAGLYLAPLPILFLGILVSFIQALVFMLLSIMYFVGAMEEAH